VKVEGENPKLGRPLRFFLLALARERLKIRRKTETANNGTANNMLQISAGFRFMTTHPLQT
jgi:hypothetical protein